MGLWVSNAYLQILTGPPHDCCSCAGVHGAGPLGAVPGLPGCPWMPGSHSPSHFDLFIHRHVEAFISARVLLPFSSEHNKYARTVQSLGRDKTTRRIQQDF